MSEARWRRGRAGPRAPRRDRRVFAQHVERSQATTTGSTRGERRGEPLVDARWQRGATVETARRSGAARGRTRCPCARGRRANAPMATPEGGERMARRAIVALRLPAGRQRLISATEATAPQIPASARGPGRSPRPIATAPNVIEQTSRDRRDPRSPARPQAVVEQRYAHSAGRARTDAQSPPMTDGGSPEKAAAERHQHSPMPGPTTVATGPPAARGKTAEEMAVPVEHGGEQGHEESHAHPFEDAYHNAPAACAALASRPSPSTSRWNFERLDAVLEELKAAKKPGRTSDRETEP